MNIHSIKTFATYKVYHPCGEYQIGIRFQYVRLPVHLCNVDGRHSPCHKDKDVGFKLGKGIGSSFTCSLVLKMTQSDQSMPSQRPT